MARRLDPYSPSRTRSARCCGASLGRLRTPTTAPSSIDYCLLPTAYCLLPTASSQTEPLEMTATSDPENTLILETTKGKIVIALRPDLASKHVERIKTLAREGFYDGIVFHRVIDGFMAQCGCQHGRGSGGST